MHARRDRVVDVKWDAARRAVLLRVFDENGGRELALAAAALRAAPPPGLAPTRVELVGNRAVVFDWSDKVRDDVYALDDLLARAAAIDGDA